MTQSNTKILICGGRNYTNKNTFYLKMSELTRGISGSITVISGGARGADTLAILWARDKGHKLTVFEADWDKYKKAAGAIRNAEMLKNGKPDLVVAFPGGNGTKHMVSISERAGVPVILV